MPEQRLEKNKEMGAKHSVKDRGNNTTMFEAGIYAQGLKFKRPFHKTVLAS
jgi:hypothetical protein